MRESILFGLVLGLTLGLCACGAPKEVENPDESIVKEAFSNTGYSAILETENGYYYNTGYVAAGRNYLETDKFNMSLRYYDKETKTSVMLCNKPECDHTDPETCVAIYKNMIVLDTMLYDNSLYVYGMEQEGIILRFALYKVALDGSSIDRVGVVFEAENTLEEEFEIVGNHTDDDQQMCGVIYKGEAYLPYRLQIGVASRGFKGGGLVRMNLQDGTVKEIFTTETKQGEVPYNIRAVGDYIYFNTTGMKSGHYRYLIPEDRMAPIENYYTEEEKAALKSLHIPGIDPDAPVYPFFDVAIGDKGYSFSYSSDVYDDGTGKPVWSDPVARLRVISLETNKEIETIQLAITGEDMSKGYSVIYYTVFAYENLLMIRDHNKLFFVSVAEDETYGKVLAELEEDESYFGYKADTFPRSIYKIKNGTLYRIVKPERKDYVYDEDGIYVNYSVYSCSIDAILEGNASWEEVFTFEKCR